MVQFFKYSGCGNDFILFDNRSQFFPCHNPQLISKLCQRQTGIGADGVLLLEDSKKGDFKMRIFNADGYEAEMCGNGLRCLIKFLNKMEIKKGPLKVETMHHVLQGDCEGNHHVSVEMVSPSQVKWDLKIPIENEEIVVHHLDTGVPHAVHFTNELEIIDLHQLGPKVRHHVHFQPKGANFNLVKVDEVQQKIWLRTYERGVEQETLACGTGAVAAAIAAFQIYNLSSPIHVHTRSGEILKISFKKVNGQISDIMLSGPVQFIYQGEIHLPEVV